MLCTLKTRYLKSIIVVTHDVDMLYDIVDNVVVLNDGKVVKTGDKISVFADVKTLDENNTPVPNIIRVERLIYDKTGIDLGFIPNINALARNISSAINKGGDLNE